MNNRYKILVIGCGSVGQRHARLLSGRRDVDLFVADKFETNLSECQKTANIKKSYLDHKKALDDGMDGVFICTPNEFHVEMALEAIKKASTVLIEKPISDNLFEAQKLLGYKNKDNVLVGYMNRFNDQIQQIKNIIDQKIMGNILYINASVYTYSTLLNARTNFRDLNKWTLVNDYTHEIDFMRYFAGDIREVFAMSGQIGELPHTPDPNIVEIMLRFRNEAIGTIHMDYVRSPDKRALEIIGDRGSIELYLTDGILRLYKSNESGFKETRMPFCRDDMFVKQIDNFINVLKGEEKPLVNLEDGIAAVKIADAVIKSCQTKSLIVL